MTLEAAASVLELCRESDHRRLLNNGKSRSDVGEVTRSLGRVAGRLVFLAIVLLREEAKIVSGGDGSVERVRGIRHARGGPKVLH
jgi:hypothetical protein